MTILSYGEDAFTLHALKYGLPNILEQLRDPTPAEDAIVVFRPSFGRGSRARPGSTRSTFGEPDALIGTPHATYIVEAKWSASGEREGENVLLRDEQTRRHRIMRAYLESWRARRPATWSAFLPLAMSDLAAIDAGIVPPRADTRLAQSLEFILTHLQSCGPVQDVLLYSRESREAEVSKLSCGDFRVVQYSCPALGSTRFVVIDGVAEFATTAA